ncbi:MAG: glycosyltransferase family 4 protein [Candidatus Firestonebacteria bacterium]
MKKALFIAYYFPPCGGGGVQRTLKFVKYISSFGWTPVVITVKENVHILEDESHSKDVPSQVKVYRTWTFEPGSKAKRFRVKFRNATAINPITIIKSLIAKTLNLLSAIFLVPDAQILWAPFAILKGISVIKNEKIDILYTTGNPFSTYLTGVFLKLILSKPLIVDFRDPWVTGEYRVWESKFRKKIEGILEKFVIKYADKVISTTELMTMDFTNTYPNEPADKFITITNGFDSDDFKGISTRRIDKKFTITYAGIIYEYLPMENFLRALKELVVENTEMAGNTRVIFVGETKELREYPIEQFGLASIIEFTGYQPHTKSVEYLLNSDVLLLFRDARTKNLYPGKMFEYFFAKKPILGLMEKGLASDLINKLNAGIIISPKDILAIKSGVYNLYQQYKEGKLSDINNPTTQNFNRKNLTEKLAGLFDKVSAS